MRYFVSFLMAVCISVLPQMLLASDCNTAQTVVPQTILSMSSTDQSFLGETFSGVVECSGPDGAADAWFQFVANSTAMSIRTEGQGDLDLAIEVYESCGGVITDCQNSNGAGLAELVSLSGLSIGNTYYFRTYHAGSVAAVSADFTVQVSYVPEVQLRASDCGQMSLTTNDIIKSTQPTFTNNVAYYQWRFEELEAPFNTYTVISENPSNPNFRMFWLSQIQYGRTYSVSVRVGTNPGPTTGEFGPACIIGLQADVLSTQLEFQYANGFYNFCDVVGCDAVGGADIYRWEFNDFSSPIVSVYGQTNQRLLKMSTVPGLRLGQGYIVRAFAEVNGMEGLVGIQRFIFMNNFVPNTGLRTEFYPCGETYPINTQVQAVEVCDAESYTWRFRNTSQVQDDLLYTREGGNRFIRLEWVTDLIEGDSYDVDVKAFQGELDGDYSSICNITIGEPLPPFILQENTDQGLDEPIVKWNDVEHSNPELYLNMIQSGDSNGDGGVVFEIASTEYTQAHVEIYDLNGRLVSYKRVNAGEEFIRINWNDLNLPKGVYVLRAFTDSAMNSRKLTVF